MDVGTVKQVDIDSEMRAAYLDYAMSVIVSRALPDARDGLKPVHRRILYAMYDMGLRPDSPYRKSARIVGEVLGKYHPHGDMAVYESMVRLAQDFAMRYPLVDGQGNFGSIDGDAAAAMRYTEARMQSIGLELLNDIDKDTVEFLENFDGSLVEPVVLPATIPNLIVNGSSGIAVGMSTSVPPHNLGEVCDALVHLLGKWTKLDDIGLPEILKFIKGPDFPTGGMVFRLNQDDESDSLAQAYGTGRGKLVVQAKAHVEELDRSRSRIIITELPYQVNKTTLIERIAELAREKRIDGITDLRDESDRQGLRIVIDLTRTVDPQEILAQLHKLTPMRTTFSIIMLALVAGEPRLLSLKHALRVFLEHRLDVVRRRSEFDLARAKERAHILEGYLVALNNLTQIIETIRNSKTAENARDNLRKSFDLSLAQAQAVLDMPLRRLADLEKRRIEEEHKEKLGNIRFFERLLKDPKLLRDSIKQELLSIKEQYSDPRRTLIVDGSAGANISMSDILVEQDVWVVVTESGLISCSYGTEQPKVTTSVKDPPRLIVAASASDILYLFAHDGMAASLPIHQISRADDYQSGTHFSSLVSLTRDQAVVAALPLAAGTLDGNLVLATLSGMVKRMKIADLPGISAHAFQTIILGEDSLGWAEWTTGNDELVLVSSRGLAIRFHEDDIRPMGLRAGGVKGIKLDETVDRVVGMLKFEARANVWVITSTGLAKSSAMVEYPRQSRYGQGVITYKFRDALGVLAGAASGALDDNLVVVTNKGKPKFMRVGLAPRAARNTPGDQIISLGDNEWVDHVVTYRPVQFLGSVGQSSG